jgi:sodium pump decarboxylase gamma subunit
MGYGIEIAVVGLAVVFTFLTALVLSVQGLGWFFRRFGDHFPDPATRPAAAAAGRGPSTAHIAAVVAVLEARRVSGES